MSTKLRRVIPTNHPKNCRCTPCLSVTSYDQKPEMTAPIREALSQEEWNRIFRATGFNMLHTHMGNVGEAMKRVGEAAKIAAGKIREANQVRVANENDPPYWQQGKNGMSAMRGPN